MSGLAEKGGGSFHGHKLLLRENPLPPIDEAIAAAMSVELMVGGAVPVSTMCSWKARRSSAVAVSGDRLR